MPNDEHVALLKQGRDAWNKWRHENRDIHPDLSGANLSGARFEPGVELSHANLSGANLCKAELNGAYLAEANLREASLESAGLVEAFLAGADLSHANLEYASFTSANLNGADLIGSMLNRANLRWANLSGATLSGAQLKEGDLRQASLVNAKLRGVNLSGADLQAAILVDTDLTDADLTGCHIYGISAWNVKLDGATQKNLIVTHADEPEVTVDNIEVAQFIYLMLNNQKLREVIDTITSKTVLILGRFTDERKAVLDALREELRKREYLPILFDFEKPRSLDTDETITLLARMARFIIADISDAKSVLQELRAIVPDLPSVPVQPIILATQEEPGMFDFYRNRPSFLTVYPYANQEQLFVELGDKVIRPAERKVRELRA
jgi:uncharacterized protein YjbI with pentapeptide repeats